MLKFVCNGKCVLLCLFCSYFNGDHMISLFFCFDLGSCLGGNDGFTFSLRFVDL